MEKRKLKINIIDVAIFIVIACAALMLVFRSNIIDTFGRTEIISFELTVSTESISPNSGTLFKTGTVLALYPKADGDESIRAVVIDSEFRSSGTAELIITCNGYEKLARHYTESGTELSSGDECEVVLGDMILRCTIENITARDTDR